MTSYLASKSQTHFHASSSYPTSVVHPQMLKRSDRVDQQKICTYQTIIFPAQTTVISSHTFLSAVFVNYCTRWEGRFEKLSQNYMDRSRPLYTSILLTRIEHLLIKNGTWSDCAITKTPFRRDRIVTDIGNWKTRITEKSY